MLSRCLALGRFRRLIGMLLLAGGLAGGLGACSLLPDQRDDEAAAPEGGPPVLRLDVQAPDALRELLLSNLDLGRVNRLARGEPLLEGELERLMAAAPQQARELLDTEGYFNAVVTVQRVGDAASSAAAGAGAAPAADAGGPPEPVLAAAPSAASAAAAQGLPRVRITVTPGPRTTVRQVELQTRGALADEADTLLHARNAAQSLRTDWPLKPGQPMRDADWVRAKAASLAGLRAQGYVQADWSATLALVDAATQRADLSATVQSGPLHRVGPLRVRGLRVQDEKTVANIADLQPGAPATEALLLDFQERLQKSDLFDRATVALEPDPQNPNATPVVATLGERRLQEATFGAGFGANVGPRLSVDHVHRRPFGRPWVARNHVDLSQVQQRWEGELSTQTLPRLYRNLIGGGLERVESDTDIVESARLRVGRAQDTRNISRLWLAEWNHSNTTSALGRERADSLAVQYQGVWRQLDDLLLPTRGQAWQGQFGVGHARSTPGGQGPFARLYARVDAYRPLGRNWYGQARLEGGQIYARGDVRVPEALRFRAGGDESVRGYEFRSLTRRVNGVEVGSEVLFTASAEVSRPILARLPQLWGAAFVDVGNAAATWADLDPAVGVGIGLRYRSPVGPVKLDLAYGEQVKRLRLHLSVGVAF